MHTPHKPFLLPTAFVTLSCLVALLYGCGGCVLSETVSGHGSETSSSETMGHESSSSESSESGGSGMSELESSEASGSGSETGDGEMGDDVGSSSQPAPSESDICTTIIEGCCWCDMADQPVCAVALTALQCADVGGSMIPGCLLISIPPITLQGPYCQFKCV